MRHLTDEQKVEIVRLFKLGKSSKEIGLIFDRSTTAINKLLRFRKLLGPSKKYTLNHDIFNQIDSEEKAYFLGLIYADGCVHKNSLALSLQKTDYDILNKFQCFMGSNHSIYIRTDPRQPNSPDMCTFKASSKKLVSDLLKLGCYERKSLILVFPTTEQVPSHLKRHFIRGYFDGDGSFTRYFNKGDNTYKYCGTIVSTLDFCTTLAKIIKDECDVNTYMQIRHKERKTTTRQLKISGRKQIFRFLEWLYKDATIYMNRKFQHFQQIKEDYDLGITSLIKR